MKAVLNTCMIIHNMIIVLDEQTPQDLILAETLHQSVSSELHSHNGTESCFASFHDFQTSMAEIRDEVQNNQIREALINHIWEQTRG